MLCWRSCDVKDRLRARFLQRAWLSPGHWALLFCVGFDPLLFGATGPRKSRRGHGCRRLIRICAPGSTRRSLALRPCRLRRAASCASSRARAPHLAAITEPSMARGRGRYRPQLADRKEPSRDRSYNHPQGGRAAQSRQKPGELVVVVKSDEPQDHGRHETVEKPRMSAFLFHDLTPVAVRPRPGATPARCAPRAAEAHGEPDRSAAVGCCCRRAGGLRRRLLKNHADEHRLLLEGAGRTLSASRPSRRWRPQPPCAPAVGRRLALS